jgi:hypothetical protein
MSARSLKGLSPASQAQTSGSTILGLTPQALRQRPLRGLKAALIRQVCCYPLKFYRTFEILQPIRSDCFAAQTGLDNLSARPASTYDEPSD